MSQRGREGGMKREIALLLWMIMTSVALLLCSLCRPEAAFWQPLCCAVPPRQHGIQFHISFALCTVVCLSLLPPPRSPAAPQPASKRPYYYREAASKRHSEATPKGGKAARAPSLCWDQRRRRKRGEQCKHASAYGMNGSRPSNYAARLGGLSLRTVRHLPRLRLSAQVCSSERVRRHSLRPLGRRRRRGRRSMLS